MVQNKSSRETQPVSEWRLLSLHPFKRFTFPSSFHTFFSCNNYHIASSVHPMSRQNMKENNSGKFYSLLMCLFLTPVSFYHLMAYWLSQSLLWKMGIQETCLIRSSWAALGGKSHRTGCKETLGETHYYMGWYYTSRKHFSRGKSSITGKHGQEGKEFEAHVVGKQLHHVKGRDKNLLERENLTGSSNNEYWNFSLIPDLEE